MVTWAKGNRLKSLSTPIFHRKLPETGEFRGIVIVDTAFDPIRVVIHPYDHNILVKISFYFYFSRFSRNLWVLFRNSVFANWSKKKISDNFENDLEIISCRPQKFSTNQKPAFTIRQEIDNERHQNPQKARRTGNKASTRWTAGQIDCAKGTTEVESEIFTTRAISGGKIPFPNTSDPPYKQGNLV